MTDYGDLKVSELVALINSEYATIIEADRSNLQRALKVGEMLIDLQPRVARYGERKLWLKGHCEISYETASLYMRLARNLEKLEQAAAARNVTLTSLTITEARDLLANKQSGTADKSASGKSSSSRSSPAVDEPGNEPPSSGVTLESFLENTAPDELFATLKDKYEEEQLRTLARLLVDHLSREQNEAA